MATESQIAANKQNAQKSSGPKTAEGKAASSLNRLSHGFASHATIIPGENPEEFKALVTGLMSEHQPATHTEQILVEKMALNQWLLCRMRHRSHYAASRTMPHRAKRSARRPAGFEVGRAQAVQHAA